MKPRWLPDGVTEKQKEEIKMMRSTWLNFHKQWVKNLPNGKHIITESSGHVVAVEEPELVVRSIQQVCGSRRNAIRQQNVSIAAKILLPFQPERHLSNR